MGVVQSALNQTKASITKYEAHLEKCWIHEEEASQEDERQSNSGEVHNDDIMVERQKESESPGREFPSTLRSPDREHTMEVDEAGSPLQASGGVTLVTPVEDHMLTGDSTLVTGEMAKLKVSSPKSQEPESEETSQ